MKLEYRNGVRISKLPHEMSLLEAGIMRYEEKAQEFYKKKNEHNAHLTKAEREAELAEAREHLNRERDHLKTLFVIQADLEAYRAEGRKAKTDRSVVNKLLAEEHHPTGLLEQNMRAEGEPKPSPTHTAHHIVPGEGLLPRVTARTRYHLHINGIRINDPANGVYLISKDKYAPHWSMPLSRGHKKYHLHVYEEYLNNVITTTDGEDFIKTKLQVIGRILQANEPKEAMGKIGAL